MPHRQVVGGEAAVKKRRSLIDPCAFRSSLPRSGIIKFNHCISAIELLVGAGTPICPAQDDSRARLEVHSRCRSFEMLHVALIDPD
jgi:hypothetical protein